MRLNYKLETFLDYLVGQSTFSMSVYRCKSKAFVSFLLARIPWFFLHINGCPLIKPRRTCLSEAIYLRYLTETTFDVLIGGKMFLFIRFIRKFTRDYLLVINPYKFVTQKVLVSGHYTGCPVPFAWNIILNFLYF